MAPPRADAKTIAYRRTHNLLLASRLLNQRDTPSPFTLILDSLNQSSKPLVAEYIRRAVISKIKVIYVSFETLRPPGNGVEIFIQARRKPLSTLLKEISLHISPTSTTTTTTNNNNKNLIIIDTLHPLCTATHHATPQSQPQLHISSFLAPLLSPTTSMIATYHTDIPIPNSPSSYTPEPLTLLRYLCTTLISVYSPVHIFQQKRAVDRSLPLPCFGLEEGINGVLVGLGGNAQQQGQQQQREYNHEYSINGIILELEHRRKSGRGVQEWYFLPPLISSSISSSTTSSQYKERITLLEDHPLYNPIDNTTQSQNQQNTDDDTNNNNSEGARREDDGLTFSLSLTEKQKMDRERIVLPYFDAQKEGGGGMGGRILYVPGREDDWDEEEDEEI